MGVLRLFFGWPTGGVWANLLSNPLWAVPLFIVHHVRLRRGHKRDTAAQTEELKAHITETLGAPAAAPGQQEATL